MHEKLAPGLTLALIIGVFAWFSLLEPTGPWRSPSADTGDSSGRLEYWHSPRGRVLNVVVEGDAVYLDEQRIEFAHARAAIEGILKTQRIHNLKFFASETARYGTVVELYASIDERVVAWKNLSTRPLIIGTRLPSIGFFKSFCCGSDDVVLMRHFGHGFEEVEFARPYAPLEPN